jgi:hypothetical protein
VQGILAQLVVTLKVEDARSIYRNQVLASLTAWCLGQGPVPALLDLARGISLEAERAIPEIESCLEEVLFESGFAFADLSDDPDGPALEPRERAVLELLAGSPFGAFKQLSETTRSLVRRHATAFRRRLEAVGRDIEARAIEALVQYTDPFDETLPVPDDPIEGTIHVMVTRGLPWKEAAIAALTPRLETLVTRLREENVR